MTNENCEHEVVIAVPSDDGFPEDGWLCAECSTEFVPVEQEPPNARSSDDG